MSKNRGRRQPIAGGNLPPIREMSGIIPPHVIPKGAKVMKGTAGHAPILVQALPPDVKEKKPTMKPSERHYTDVDQIVSDYLHYAKYGQVLPVLPESGLGGLGGGAGLRCACCVDRNRENVMKRMAIQRGMDPANLTTNPDAPRDVPELHNPPEQVGTSTASTDDSPGVSRRIPAPQASPRHAPMPWSHYQPTPYAGTFLNPEFNRPFVMHAAEEDSTRLTSDEHLIYDKVLHADSLYEQNMKKLRSHYNSSFEVPNDSIIIDKDAENPYS